MLMELGVDVDEVMRLITRRREINSIPIMDAIFVRDGRPVEISSEIRDEHRFTGLSLCDFVELVIFGQGEKFGDDGEVISVPPILQI
jgi:hypothetical protein